MKIQPSICLDDRGKPRKNPSQVGRHRDWNSGPPECESHALPRSHLARCHFLVTTVSENNFLYSAVCYINKALLLLLLLLLLLVLLWQSFVVGEDATNSRTFYYSDSRKFRNLSTSNI